MIFGLNNFFFFFVNLPKPSLIPTFLFQLNALLEYLQSLGLFPIISPPLTSLCFL